jgi:hypothetical protein
MSVLHMGAILPAERPRLEVAVFYPPIYLILPDALRPLGVLGYQQQ